MEFFFFFLVSTFFFFWIESLKSNVFFFSFSNKVRKEEREELRERERERERERFYNLKCRIFKLIILLR